MKKSFAGNGGGGGIGDGALDSFRFNLTDCLERRAARRRENLLPWVSTFQAYNIKMYYYIILLSPYITNKNIFFNTILMKQILQYLTLTTLE